MHILGWLIKHPIFLAWLLAILAILLNFGIKGGHDEHATKGEQAAGHSHAAVESATQQQAAAPVAAEPAAQQQAAAPVAAEPAAQQQAAAPVAAEPAAQQQASAPVAAEPAAQQQAAAPVAAEPAAQQQATAPVAAEPAAQQQAAAPVAAEPAAQQQAAAPVAAEPAAQQQAAVPVASQSPAELLRLAREAYWNNDLEKASALYFQLIQQDANTENKGELANVYWKQGKAKEAAALFAEIAPQIAAQGRMTEAMNMKLYVDLVDPELGKQLGSVLKQ